MTRIEMFFIESRGSFHTGCLRSWANMRLQNNRDVTCPLCRGDLRYEQKRPPIDLIRVDLLDLIHMLLSESDTAWSSLPSQ